MGSVFKYYFTNRTVPMFICIYIYTAKNLKNLCPCTQFCENVFKNTLGIMKK